MRWALLLLLALNLPQAVYAQASNEDAADRPPSPELPSDPLSERATDAYKAGRYNEAGRLLFDLAKRYPENPAVYRAMARTHNETEPAKAIVAYRHYLELAPDATDRDKVNQELALLLRRVEKPPPSEPPAAIRKAFEDIEVRAKAGKFTGKVGAFGALESIVAAGHVSPRLGSVQRSIRKALSEHSESAVDRWWNTASRAKTSTLTELAAAWEKTSEIRALNGEEKKWFAAVDGLAHLASGEAAKAAEILGPVAPGDKRLRFAQVISLLRLERYDEAKVILDALSRGRADARVHLLSGFVKQKTEEDSTAVESFMMALDNEDEP